jgi:ribosomal protein S18 acetylase RimI-like enzyme
LREPFDLYINSDRHGIFVAERGKKIVGMVAYSMSHIFVTSKMRFYIEGLVVDENHRRQKIGQLLMEEIEKVARSNAPCVVDFVSRSTRAKFGVHDFYRTMGYEYSGESTKVYFRKEFDDNCVRNTK